MDSCVSTMRLISIKAKGSSPLPLLYLLPTWPEHLQVGLVDMLKEEYGIEPAGMLGHSAGEIPCGYADGCLTREQTILIAYHRGRPPMHAALLYSDDRSFLRHA